MKKYASKFLAIVSLLSLLLQSAYPVILAYEHTDPDSGTSCTLSVDNTSVTQGESVTYTISSSSYGYSAYWRGNENGQSVNAPVEEFANTNYWTKTYPLNEPGTYSNYIEVFDEEGNIICTTNTVTVSVEPESEPPTEPSQTPDPWGDYSGDINPGQTQDPDTPPEPTTPFETPNIHYEGELCEASVSCSASVPNAEDSSKPLYCRSIGQDSYQWVTQEYANSRCNENDINLTAVCNEQTFYCNGTTWSSEPVQTAPSHSPSQEEPAASPLPTSEPTPEPSPFIPVFANPASQETAQEIEEGLAMQYARERLQSFTADRQQGEVDYQNNLAYTIDQTTEVVGGVVGNTAEQINSTIQNFGIGSPSSPPSNITCSLKAEPQTIEAGGQVSYAIDSSSYGYSAFWKGSENGQSIDYQVESFQNTNYWTKTYTHNTSGTLNYQVQILNDAGETLCTTNPVEIRVTEKTAQPTAEDSLKEQQILESFNEANKNLGITVSGNLNNPTFNIQATSTYATTATSGTQFLFNSSKEEQKKFFTESKKRVDNMVFTTADFFFANVPEILVNKAADIVDQYSLTTAVCQKAGVDVLFDPSYREQITGSIRLKGKTGLDFKQWQDFAKTINPSSANPFSEEQIEQGRQKASEAIKERLDSQSFAYQSKLDEVNGMSVEQAKQGCTQAFEEFISHQKELDAELQSTQIMLLAGEPIATLQTAGIKAAAPKVKEASRIAGAQIATFIPQPVKDITSQVVDTTGQALNALRNRLSFVPRMTQTDSPTQPTNIWQARNFQELYQVLRMKGGLQGTTDYYNSHQLIYLIEEVRSNPQNLNFLTRTEGLRFKVAELIEVETLEVNRQQALRILTNNPQLLSRYPKGVINQAIEVVNVIYGPQALSDALAPHRVAFISGWISKGISTETILERWRLAISTTEFLQSYTGRKEDLLTKIPSSATKVVKDTLEFLRDTNVSSEVLQNDNLPLIILEALLRKEAVRGDFQIALRDSETVLRKLVEFAGEGPVNFERLLDQKKIHLVTPKKIDNYGGFYCYLDKSVTLNIISGLNPAVCVHELIHKQAHLVTSKNIPAIDFRYFATHLGGIDNATKFEEGLTEWITRTGLKLAGMESQRTAYEPQVTVIYRLVNLLEAKILATKPGLSTSELDSMIDRLIIRAHLYNEYDNLYRTIGGGNIASGRAAIRSILDETPSAYEDINRIIMQKRAEEALLYAAAGGILYATRYYQQQPSEGQEQNTPPAKQLPFNFNPVPTAHASEKNTQKLDTSITRYLVTQDLIKNELLTRGNVDIDFIRELNRSNFFTSKLTNTFAGYSFFIDEPGSVGGTIKPGKYKVAITPIPKIDIRVQALIETGQKPAILPIAVKEGLGRVEIVADQKPKSKLLNLFNTTQQDPSQLNTSITILVFHDKNANGKLDSDEEILPGIGLQGELKYINQEKILLLNPGWNLISLNVLPAKPLNASTLLQEIAKQGGYATTVSTLENGAWKSFVVRGDKTYSGDDFPIQLGKAYFIKALKSSVLVYQGQELVAPIKLKLTSGWNGVGVPYSEKPYLAADFIDTLNTKEAGSDTASRWESGLWDTFVKQEKESFGENFPIEQARGYLLKVAKGLEFSP